jgi:endonuclease-3
MATTINKQRLLNQLLSASRKAAESKPDERPVLEEFIYGICRESATPEQADQAFRFLREKFFDWNEVRVSSVRELEEAFDGMPNAELRAQRVISFLQEVFETTYSFELEGLQKKGLKNAARSLGRFQAANDFVTSWVIQRSLAGHAVPLDPPTLRCCRRLGLLDSAVDDLESARASLEHLVPKAKGHQAADSLSVVATEFCHEDEPRCSACPMSGECSHAQERGVEAVPAGAGSGRAHRPKPR